jgi:ribosomal protein S18 acetylase RimI-like enzyme
MPDLHIRRYDPADADAVWALHVRALSHAGAYDEEFAHLDADLRAIEEAYFDVGGAFLVGEYDGELVAMGGFQPVSAAGTLAEIHAQLAHGDAAALRRMRVDPDHHRRGFGSAILEALEARARDRGFDSLTLDTTPVQEAAIAFYESHGYERRRTETFAGHEVLFYAKALGRG